MSVFRWDFKREASLSTQRSTKHPIRCWICKLEGESGWFTEWFTESGSSRGCVVWPEGARWEWHVPIRPAVLTDTPESEEQDGGFSLPAPKTDHEAVVRTGWYWHRQIDHWQRIESPEHSRHIWLALQLNEKNDIIQSTYLFIGNWLLLWRKIQ